MKLTLTPRKLLKTIAGKDEPVSGGFGKLIMHYRLSNREEDARLIEALFALYQRGLQPNRHGSYAEFEQRMQVKRRKP